MYELHESQMQIQFFISGLELYSFSMMEGVLEKDNLNCPICDIEVASEQNLENHILFVHDGNHRVSWVRNDSAEDTCEVTRHEGDHELS